jgi:hypothetical protein
MVSLTRRQAGIAVVGAALEIAALASGGRTASAGPIEDAIARQKQRIADLRKDSDEKQEDINCKRDLISLIKSGKLSPQRLNAALGKSSFDEVGTCKKVKSALNL